MSRRSDPAEQEACALAHRALSEPGPGLARRPLRVLPQGPGRTSSLGLGSGEALPATVRDFFEPRFGRDFSQVRVHVDRTSADAARAVNARAVTVANHVIFGQAQFAPDSRSGQALLAHELAHVVQQGEGRSPVIQRAEVDDNPEFCFPSKGGGAPLTDIKEVVNKWIAGARATTNTGGLAQPAAIYRNLGGSGPRSRIEEMIALESPTAVRTVKPSESRFAGQEHYPGLAAQLRTGRLAPVVNLCGVCVGADKLGHFIQQGYEYFQLEQALRARIKNWSDKERQDFRDKISGPPLDLPPLMMTPRSDQPPLVIEFPASYMEDTLIDIYTNEFGKWLEGFKTNLPETEIKWIKSQPFIPWYYQKGVYGASFSGAESRADVAANASGGQFYRDLWRDPTMTPDICNYVSSRWNERSNLTTYVTFPRPTGPQSESEALEYP